MPAHWSIGRPSLLGKEMNVISMPPTVQQPYCWLFAHNEQKIGVHQTKGWCTQLRDDAPLFFDIEEKCVLMLILLELAPGEFDRYLADSRRTVPAYAESIACFPLTKLLKHTFHQSVSDYWPEKALNWLDARPDLQHEVLAELEHMVTNKAMSQSLRHRTRSMVRKLRRDTMFA